MADISKNYRAESRKEWSVRKDEAKSMTNEEITVGCMLRIADSCEAIAKNHVKLQHDLDWYKAAYERLRTDNKKLSNSIRGYKSQITKLKK